MLVRALGITLAASLALAVARPAWSAGNCPANQMGVTDPIGVVYSNLPADSRFGHLSSVRYNIPAGSLHAGASSANEDYGVASLVVEDEFGVVGLGPGTPVPLVAHFKGMGTSAIVEILDAFGHVASGQFDPFVSPQLDLALDLPVVSGQPFHVQFSVFVSGGGLYGGDDATMTFSFAGVPPGAAVVSCNGYVSDRTVPTRPATWGGLKRLYR